ncbi:hypothetical protein Bca52824_074281 [Brassica carinata]|uniref:Sugar phosphate transporter domain-containing protein n=1 Tax=Brassica carinata TaxID=52824 RepID=A0A8X7TUM3_BRACI|nr:hypothetical protein Bca52824_074281 [Brassica carinata]
MLSLSRSTFSENSSIVDRTTSVIVPTALATALDINLSNESLVFISVTFATMCKSASPIFLLLFAFAFRLESPSLKLFGIISVISAGVLLSVAKETEFEFWGFVFVMLAAVMSGFRWCMTQVLLQVCLKNPFTFMSYVAPVMAIVTGLLSLLLDPWSEFRDNIYFDSGHFTRTCFLMLLVEHWLFILLQVLTEYILVSVTSAVTVTIAGVVKEAVTIVVAVFYFHGNSVAERIWSDDYHGWCQFVQLVQIRETTKGHKTEDDKHLQAPSQTGKYVILDETDDQENGP